MANAKISTNKVSKDSLLTYYANSPEVNVLSPSFIALLKDNAIANTTDSYLSSQNLNVDDTMEISAEINEIDSATASESSDTGSSSSDPSFMVAPVLSDISILSQEVSYDSSGNPSVTVTVRIKNSNSLLIKSVNAKVQLI